MLLPLVIVYIIYLNKNRIYEQEWQPNWKGLLIILFGFLVYTTAKIIADPHTSRYSFVIVLFGLIYYLGGKNIVKLFIFPLILILLMFPLPNFLMSSVTLRLQLISSQLAAFLLRGMGIPLVLSGNVIDMGYRQLQVVEACSGLRYILSLTAIGLIYCYFYQRNIIKNIILLLTIVPSAILANSFRVAAMGIFPFLQEGFWHGFTGWLIYLFCLGLLIVTNWVLNKIWVTPEAADDTEILDSPRVSYPGGLAKVTPNRLITAIVIIVVGGSLVFTVGNPPPVPLLKQFTDFPLSLGPWTGHRQYIDADTFKKTEASSYFDAEYSQPGLPPVSLYMAHYETQSTPGGITHNPGTCMTGSGWTTLDQGEKQIAPNLPVRFLLLETKGRKLLVNYWSIHQGDWLAFDSFRIYRFYTIFKALHANRTDWLLVRLITPVITNMEEAQARLSEFGKLVIPILPQFIKSSFPTQVTSAGNTPATRP